MKNVEEEKLTLIGVTEKWTQRKRAHFLKQPFEREPGSGVMWHAVEVGKRRRINKYGCELVSKTGQDKLTWLSVSIVQKLIKQYESSS